MFERSHIIVGLDIGTGKIACCVGELLPSRKLHIIGLGQAPSDGVRKGDIIDNKKVEEGVRRAMAEAEKMANAEIKSVFLGVSGGHLRGFNNRGSLPIYPPGRQIAEEDIEGVVQNAKAINLPPDHAAFHCIRQHYHLDEQIGLRTPPVGMFGARLDLEMLVVHGKANRLKNAIALVKGLQMEVEAAVFSGIATSLAVLSNAQKEEGSLVIDLGAGVAEYLVYAGGVIKHAGVLAVGGDHLSNDLAFGLNVSLGLAEKLKAEHGAAICDASVHGQTITLDHERGLPGRKINIENLRRIMALRIEEIFRVIEEDLTPLGLLPQINSVVLCGGGARIPQITTVAEQVFAAPAMIGRIGDVASLPASLDQPEFATSIGLVKYGSFQQRSSGGWWKGGANVAGGDESGGDGGGDGGGLFDRVRRFLKY